MDARLALRATGVLRAFNEAGVLVPADVHVARRLARLTGEADEWVALAAALAVRGPRLGHVYVDLATVRETATVDADEPVDLGGRPWPAPGGAPMDFSGRPWPAGDAPMDLGGLPWPPPDEWVDRVAASDLVAVGEDGDDRPLRLVGSWLYLDRYWREERQVAADLLAFGDRPAPPVDGERLADGLARLFDDDRQRLAGETALRRRFAVVAGGPGTGKTTTVARILALLFEQGEPLVALAAPTGKAQARLIEAVREEAIALDVSADVRARLLALEASTLHRLLGWRPGSHSRFRHDRTNRLPHDVVIVDETSMVSLSQMARLVEAVRPDARLILVGDPGQLTSIEAGAVLGDIVGPADRDGDGAAPADRDLAGRADRGSVGPADRGGIVVLDRVHRFGGGIARVAEAIRRGDADAVIDALDEVTWIRSGALGPVQDAAVATAQAVTEAARAGAAERAIEALGAFRVLCAHRRDVAAWTARVEGWVGAGAEGDWYVGRPLLVTENDYGLGLFNGDTGVVIATADGRATAAFQRSGRVVEYSPARLSAVETVYAMTIHKSQGSQFDTAAVLLPDPTSRLLTRELLYTAVTRARNELILVGTEQSIRVAVARPVARASGLRWRLWGEPRSEP